MCVSIIRDDTDCKKGLDSSCTSSRTINSSSRCWWLVAVKDEEEGEEVVEERRDTPRLEGKKLRKGSQKKCVLERHNKEEREREEPRQRENVDEQETKGMMMLKTKSQEKFHLTQPPF